MLQWYMHTHAHKHMRVHTRHTHTPDSNNIQLHLHGDVKQVAGLLHRGPELHPEVADGVRVVSPDADQQLCRGVGAGHLAQLNLVVKGHLADILAGGKPEVETR